MRDAPPIPFTHRAQPQRLFAALAPAEMSLVANKHWRGRRVWDFF